MLTHVHRLMWRNSTVRLMFNFHIIDEFFLSSFKSGFDHTEATPCLEYVCHDLLSELETAMARVSEELKTFREKGEKPSGAHDTAYSRFAIQ